MSPHQRKTEAGPGGGSLWSDWLNRTQAPFAPRPANRAVLGAAALALLAGTALAPSAIAQGAPPAAPPVTVAAPLSRLVPQWEEHTARIEPSMSAEVEITSDDDGGLNIEDNVIRELARSLRPQRR